tara:strand:- start:1090 stop:1254 length:165 start_codon:yes stop_codon:yes gene_type:complete
MNSHKANYMKWVMSILIAILIWPIVFIGVVIVLELLLTIGLIVAIAHYIKRRMK